MCEHFSVQAFKALQCELRPREGGRYESTLRSGQASGSGTGSSAGVILCSSAMSASAFERHQVRMYGKPMASLIHPGHPLMAAITDLIIEAHATKLKQGTVFVDPTDEGDTPKVMIMLDHAVRESPYGQDERQVASRRMQFVQIDAQGTVTSTGWAPHLDLEPLPEEDASLIQDILRQPWLCETLEQQALNYAAEKLARRKGQDASLFSADATRRAQIEHIAMQKVFEYERANGYTTEDVSAEKCGWDISSFKPGHPDRHIEVKGRAKGQSTITVIRN
ncbi:MAG: DUF3883 domain-containing protein [Desulfovermiculus sp.]|nr:DUF3883 domain-containing protein [Desulfovermiculus sp.]